MTGNNQFHPIWSEGCANARLARSRVLVTGATGFIGNLLVSRLSSMGCRIRLLVENQYGYDFDNLDVNQGDLLSPDSLARVGREADIVYHLAAFTDPDAKSGEDVERCFAINVEGTKNLLGSLDPSTKHLIFFSTIYVYGHQYGEGINEASAANPTTAYGQSKLEAENLVLEWGLRQGVMTTCLRLPFVYGPGNKGNILRMIDAIAKRRFLVIGKGKNKRSMVYVENVVDAAIAVAYQKAADGEVFIVTDGADYSMLDLYQTISRSLGMRPLPVRVPGSIARAAGSAFDLIERVLGFELPYDSKVLTRLSTTLTFSANKIEEEVGFRPGYDLREGMTETVRWYKDNK